MYKTCTILFFLVVCGCKYLILKRGKIMKKLGWFITLFCIHYNVYAHASERINSLGKIPVGNLHSYLQNCESENSNIPNTEFDLVLGVLGLGDHNKFAQSRECLEQKLQEAAKEICQAKESIYAQAHKYKNDDQRDSDIAHIEELHLRHQEWLLDQADRYHAKAERYDDSNSMLQGELKAYAEIFESESYVSSCPYGDRES